MPELSADKKWYTQFCDGMETPLKRTLAGLIRLTRFDEYGYFVVITTLLGIAAARGVFNARLVVALLANWLAVSFAYMVNDIEDAPDDAFSIKNCHRNPVSNGMISPKTAKIATMIVALLAAGFYAFLGWWPFILGVTSLLLGIMYSLKTIRLKTMAMISLISRGLMLAGLPFLCGYFAFTSTLNRIWFWPFLFVMSISVFYAHQDEDKLDRGERITGLMVTLTGILIVSTGVVSFFLIELIPAWVMLTISGLVVICILPPYLKMRRSGVDEPLRCLIISTFERSFAIGLMLQFFLPWLSQLIHLRWF